ncbi:MAG: N,N-dimethylformamidase beta subunit family domain-containing protein [Actinomycetes bacterium]
MIRAFPQQPSPRPGEDLVLHVATDAPQFRVELFRYPDGRHPVLRSEWLDGEAAPLHLPHHDWRRSNIGLHGEQLEAWPAYRLPIPDDWPSAVYLAHLVEGDGTGNDISAIDASTPDSRTASALVALRPRVPGRRRILYKLPLLTWHAYNVVDGSSYDPSTGEGQWCFYSPDFPLGATREVNVHRPGGGTGGHPYDTFNWDPFDPTPRQTFVHWDAPFLTWLAREGYEVDVCTDLDLHREGLSLLEPYRVLVSVGHDEYWSTPMRAAVEDFVAAGGNAAFFSGNTCWWHVDFSDEWTYRRTTQWGAGVGEPEAAFLGTSFRNGGERDRNEEPVPVGYRVQHPDHWVFDGTGLRHGDVIGAEQSLVGYECDGAHFDRDAWQASGVASASGRDGTPQEFTILGVGDVSAWRLREGNGAATMGVVEKQGAGVVFSAGTTDWPRVLAAGDPSVERITRNVLDRLSDGPSD